MNYHFCACEKSQNRLILSFFIKFLYTLLDGVFSTPKLLGGVKFPVISLTCTFCVCVAYRCIMNTALKLSEWVDVLYRKEFEIHLLHRIRFSTIISLPTNTPPRKKVSYACVFKLSCHGPSEKDNFKYRFHRVAVKSMNDFFIGFTEFR